MHSSRTTAAVCLLLSVLLGSCTGQAEWTRFRGEGGRGHSRNLMTPPLGIRWELSLQSEDQRGFAFNNLVIRENRLYFGTTDGNFYAMNIETGYMDWVYRTGAPVNSVPYADETHVYFGSNDGHVYAVHRESGEEAWRFNTGSTVQSTVIRHEDQIIFGSDGGGIWFLSLDGELEHYIDNPVWHRVSLQVDRNRLMLTPGPIENPRTLGVYDLREQRHLWLLPEEIMQATWYSFPASTGDAMIMQTSRFGGDGLIFNTYSLDFDTGDIQWSRSFSSTFGTHAPDDLFRYWRRDLLNILDYQAPAVWRNSVIVAGGDNTVRALNVDNGNILWEKQFNHHTSSAPMVVGDTVFIGIHGDRDDRIPEGEERTGPRLVALSARSGSRVWEFETNGVILSPPVSAGRHMVFGTDRNFVYVLERVF
ncbi:MAG: hypothetical protein EA383_12590 [Spirochaetaceae bacterium]|nr:MAG: hypothetical protein EA383_12590 [Spirochaetaceae bacterium]